MVLPVRLGADHERVPGPGTEEVGFAKVGVAEVRIYIAGCCFFQSFHVATPIDPSLSIPCAMMSGLRASLFATTEENITCWPSATKDVTNSRVTLGMSGLKVALLTEKYSVL